MANQPLNFPAAPMDHVGNVIINERAQQLLEIADAAAVAGGAIRRAEIRDPKFKETNEEFNVEKFFKDHLTCTICNQILYHPVTLTCQHSYCYACLLELQKSENQRNMPYHMHPRGPGRQVNENTRIHKCPTCNTRFFLPPHKMQNYVLRNIIESFIDDPEYFQERDKEEQKRNPELKNEIREELKRELLPDLFENLQLMDREGGGGMCPGPYEYRPAPMPMQMYEPCPIGGPPGEIIKDDEDSEEKKEDSYLTKVYNYVTDPMVSMRIAASSLAIYTVSKVVLETDTIIQAAKKLIQDPSVLTGVGSFMFVDYLSYRQRYNNLNNIRY